MPIPSIALLALPFSEDHIAPLAKSGSLDHVLLCGCKSDNPVCMPLQGSTLLTMQGISFHAAPACWEWSISHHEVPFCWISMAVTSASRSCRPVSTPSGFLMPLLGATPPGVWASSNLKYVYAHYSRSLPCSLHQIIWSLTTIYLVTFWTWLTTSSMHAQS